MVARICEKLVKYHETKIMFSAIPVIGFKKLTTRLILTEIILRLFLHLH